MTRVALALAALTLAGCPDKGKASKGEAAPTSTATALASASPAQAATAKPKGEGESVAAASGERLPIAVGQWTRHKIKSERGNGSVSHRITGKEGSAHWLRFDYQAQGTSLSFEALVDFGDLKDFRKADIKKAKIVLPTGQTHLLEGATLNKVKVKFADALGNFTGSAMLDKSKPREDVTVPAATFRSCFKSEETVKAFGFTSESTVWRHTAVPLTTMVKMVSKDGNVWELDGYGVKPEETK